MPLTGNYAGVRRLERALGGLAAPDGAGRKLLLGGVEAEVRGLLYQEFSDGIGPDGEPWEPTKQGKPALISKKLPAAFSSRIDRGIVRFTGKTARDMLIAHQFGYTFPPRKVAAGKHYLSFNSKGKLVAERRIFKKDGAVRRGAYQRFAAAHEIRQRILVARQVYPLGGLPTRWERAIARGTGAGLQRWGKDAER